MVGKPPQNGGDGDNVDVDRPRLGLVQPLHSTLARLPPPGGGVPAEDPNLPVRFTLSLACVYKCVYKVHIEFAHCLGLHKQDSTIP